MIKYILSALLFCIMLCNCNSEHQEEHQEEHGQSGKLNKIISECPPKLPECISAPQNVLDVEGIPCREHFDCSRYAKFACYDAFCTSIDGEGNGVCHLVLADDGVYCGEQNEQSWQCDQNQKCCH